MSILRGIYSLYNYYRVGGLKIEYKKFDLYKVDMKYIRDLHNVDDRVSSVSPQIGKENRVYIGIVVMCNNNKYVIPLSHSKQKHTQMKTTADFDKIFDKKGRLIAVLNFNLMIPVEDNQIQKVDLKIKSSDSDRDRSYKILCMNELKYCRRKDVAKRITDKASTLYDLCTKDSGYKGKVRCLDFVKLEKVCKRYNEKHFAG